MTTFELGAELRALSPASNAPPLSFYAWAYRHLFFPTWQRLVHRRPIAAHLDLLEATQWLSADEMERVQVSELRALLAHAGANVPYWRELFARLGFDARDVRTRDDLAALPILTREIVRERHDDLIDPARRGTNIKKGTSGTTGTPLQFEYCNESEAWRQASRLRGYAWAGYRLGLPTLHYWGGGAPARRGLVAAKMQLDRALRREEYVDAARQDEASMERTAAAIARMKPHAIIAFTQALAIFAHWVVDRGRRDWGDVRVLCGAEGVFPSDREAIARAFGPAVFETYGSRETMLVAAECEAHDGMHLSEENLLVEIVRDGHLAPAGEPGDVVVTDLHNYGMPFIRYANGDVATLARDEACACGRALRRLERVDGRRADTMHDEKGAPVPGLIVGSLLSAHADVVRQFQAVQRLSGEVELRIVRGRNWNEEKFAETTRRLASYFGGLPLRVVHVREIPPDASGKRRPIVVERVRST
jgi:phenylacetate-CoA ligase